MPKMFEIPLKLYVLAHDEKAAAALAEMHSFSASMALRKNNSGWTEDTTTTLKVSGTPSETNDIVKVDCDKQKIIEVFGEDRGIRIMSHFNGD